MIIALVAGGDGGRVSKRPVQMDASKCQKGKPNYVGSVGVSAWDESHRRAGVKVWIDPVMASILDIGGTSLRDRIARRLSRWDTPNVPRVATFVENVADSDISIVYGLTPFQRGIDGITTRTLVAGSFTTQARIQLNTLEALGLETGAFLDSAVLDSLAAAALHEFGHALGINGHSPVRRDLMFLDGSGEACGAACGPTKGDKNTLAYLACRAIEDGTGWATR
ncbi:MAG: hypothetical protein ABI672_17740 [Vicinamibacteria bacterium]